MLSVITITYGNRWHLLRQVLNILINDNNVDHILVVNNGVEYNISNALEELLSSKIELLNLDKNYGASKAYKLGLLHLMKDKKNELVWLLDDDNLPAPKSLETLLMNWQLALNSRGNETGLALLSIRKDRNYLLNVSHGEDVCKNFPCDNNFLGFNFLNIPRIIVTLYNIQNKKRNSITLDKVKIPMAPFGGLLFNIKSLELIGLPDERFFIYYDDFEFTYRFTKNQGAIWLIPKSEVIDIEKSWTIRYYSSFFYSKYLQKNSERSYYSVRNFTYFAKTHLVSNKFIFLTNIMIYVMYISAIAIFLGRLKELKLFCMAVYHGYNENFLRDTQ